ncbi:MAG: hypothetical protein LQ346_001752 [Caloplaca aetnensis]|nr:MAG: hypothetical protein LQ346_001752 [Caloplaca aetnensis]
MTRCHLLSCPNEVIHQIADELFPEDLVSFILSNRAVHSASQHVVRQHQILLEQYSSLRFGDPEESGDGDKFEGNHPLYLLEAIFQNPKIAHYPIKIRVGDYDEICEYDDDNLPSSISSPWNSEIAALGTGNPWLREQSRRQVWAQDLMVRTNHTWHLAILLTMLPNLELIKLADMTHEFSEPIREMVWAIAAANQDPASPVHGKALANLIDFSLDTSQTEYGGDITMYTPFAGLPSLRFLHGRMVEGEDFRNQPQRERYWYGTTMPLRPGQIEDVNFMYSAIGTDAWEWMFKFIGNNLKRFAYDHAEALSDYSAPYDCAGIVGIVRRHASHSLRRMELTANLGVSGTLDRITGAFNEDYNHQFVGDLKAFATLRILRLDDTAFQMTKQGAIARLIDVLPTSIRVVRLLREIKVGDPADLFAGLAEGKTEVLPELKRVFLEGDYVLRRGVIDECEAVGIEVTGPCLQIIGT